MERQNRENLRAMGIAQNMWVEVIHYVFYFLNRLRTKALKHSTPYKAWKGRKPKLEHLRMFSCTTHVKTPHTRLNKL